MRFAWIPKTSAALLMCIGQALAGIPDNYHPIPIEPPFSFSERLIDLTPALSKAKKEGKPLLIYMGAQDCPPCKEYERFLEQNHHTLASTYESLVVVDVRSWLKGPKLVFQVTDKRYTLEEFKAAVGDINKTYTWPYWWLINPDLRQLKQLPRGSKNYLEVELHKNLFRIEKTTK